MDNMRQDASAPSESQSNADAQRQASYQNQSVDSTDHNGIPKLKRTACILCRRRKLRCDQIRPKCGTCERLGHDCQYDEGGRKKSGPKRGYVKALEARLAQVETLLKTQDMPDYNLGDGEFVRDIDLGISDPLEGPDLNQLTIGEHPSQSNSPQPQNAQGPGGPAQFGGKDGVFQTEFSFDMIALGLEEPLPTLESMDELNDLYFTKAHMTLPMIHKARYYAAMDLAPAMRPPVCLRYAMWACAASISNKYENHSHIFYERARKYLELDEMRGMGQAILTLAHCQTWVLVTMYEFKNMFFPRAWMSTGRATRLAQMLGLHRIDGTGLDVKQTMAPPRDWTEKEERRRTFWMAYWCDRCASIGTGWPMALEEKDILTVLPCNEDDFQYNRPTSSPTLQTALRSIDRNMSSTAGSTLMATLFGRNLTHLHRAEPDDNEDDLNGKFWQRHREIDNTLLNLTLSLPDHLRLPFGMMDPNVIFLNMCLHSSTICLHQAAIFKADKHRLPAHVASESKLRCISAATEIASIMRSVCHMQSSSINPFTAFCLYVSARVFVQYLKARPGDQQSLSSLTFLLTAMHSMTRRAAITESFIAQLELDMEVAKVPNPYNANKSQDEVSAMPYPRHNLFPNDEYIEDPPHKLSQPGRETRSPRPNCLVGGSLEVNMGSSTPSTGSAGKGPTAHYGHTTVTVDRTRSDGAGSYDNMFDTDQRGLSSQIIEMDTSPDSTGIGMSGENRSQSVGASRTSSVATGMTSPVDQSAPASDPSDGPRRTSGTRMGTQSNAPMAAAQNNPAHPQVLSGFSHNHYFDAFSQAGPCAPNTANASQSQQQPHRQQQQQQQQPGSRGMNSVGSQQNFSTDDGFGFPSMSYNPSTGLEDNWDQNNGMTPNTQAWNDIIDTMGSGGAIWGPSINTGEGR